MKRGFAIAAVLALASAFLVSPRARAQSTCTAQGKVVDAEGNPIPDVQVLLDYKGHVTQKYKTKTDKKGVFIHVNVYEGPYRVTFTKEGLGEVSFSTSIREIGNTEKPPEYKFVVRAAAPAAPPPGSGLAPAGAPAAGAPALDLGKLKAEINAAIALSQQGKVDEAIAAYEAIVAQTPQIPLVQYNLGAAYSKKGDAAKAEAAYRKSFELDPGFVDGYVGLADVLRESGKTPQAIETIQQGAEANPQSGRLQYALGVLELSAGQGAKAREAQLKAETLDPQNFEIQYQLAIVAINLNDKPEAIARLEKFITAAPPDTPSVAAAKSLLAALQKK